MGVLLIPGLGLAVGTCRLLDRGCDGIWLDRRLAGIGRVCRGKWLVGASSPSSTDDEPDDDAYRECDDGNAAHDSADDGTSVAV